jgi:outer membrane protein assembly factor BamB
VFGDDRFIFEMDGYRFIGFNTGPYMKMGDGHVKQEDLIWLDNQLSGVNSSHQTISLAHYPLLEGLDNWPEVTSVLKEYGVNLALCGHGHQLQLLNFNGIAGVMGRSLISRDGKDVGYTLVTLKNDSVFVDEKLLNQPRKPFQAWSLSNRSIIDSLAISKIPDYSINDSFPDVSVVKTFQDDASVLGGIASHPSGLIFWANSKGILKGLDTQSMKVIWEQEIGSTSFATPVIHGDNIMIGTNRATIEAYNVFSGKKEWITPVTHPVFSDGIAEDGYLFLGCGKGGMYKLNVENGAVIWSFQNINGFVQAQPCVTAEEVIFGAWDRHLYCLDKQTGRLKWKWNNGHGAVLYSPGNVVPVVAEGKVFIVAPDRYFTVLSLVDGSVIYRTNEHKVRESLGISVNKEMVFAKLMNDSIVVFPTDDVTKGSNWSSYVGFGYDHNPCPLGESGGVLYGGTKNGVLFAVDPIQRNVIWQHKFGNSAINKIILTSDSSICLVLMEGIVAKLTDIKN